VVQPIVAHIASGKNYATGDVGSPIGFLAASHYGAGIILVNLHNCSHKASMQRCSCHRPFLHTTYMQADEPFNYFVPLPLS